jgi:hypothetical protein
VRARVLRSPRWADRQITVQGYRSPRRKPDRLPSSPGGLRLALSIPEELVEAIAMRCRDRAGAAVSVVSNLAVSLGRRRRCVRFRLPDGQATRPVEPRESRTQASSEESGCSLGWIPQAPSHLRYDPLPARPEREAGPGLARTSLASVHARDPRPSIGGRPPGRELPGRRDGRQQTGNRSHRYRPKRGSRGAVRNADGASGAENDRDRRGRLIIRRSQARVLAGPNREALQTRDFSVSRDLRGSLEGYGRVHTRTE